MPHDLHRTSFGGGADLAGLGGPELVFEWKRFMIGATMRTPTARGPGGSRGNLLREAETMSSTRLKARWHARRLAQEAIGGAGRRKDVADATGRSESTVSSDVTERYHPEAFDLLLNLIESPGTTGRAFAERCIEAVELHEILNSSREVLIERGLFLMPTENRADSEEDDASLMGPVRWAVSLQKVRDVSGELAIVVLVLWHHFGVDLRRVYEDRMRAA